MNPLFPDEIILAAQASQAKWQIPASLTLAQWAVESEYGKRMPKGSNNPFGIKALPGQPTVEATTSEDPSGSNRPTGTQPFRKFASLEEAFDVHGRLLGLGHPYHNMVTAYLASPRAYADINRLANALTGVYAVAQNYGATLISVMTKWNLYQYDKEKIMVDTPVAPATPVVVPPSPGASPVAHGIAIGDFAQVLLKGIDLAIPVGLQIGETLVPFPFNVILQAGGTALEGYLHQEINSAEVAVAGAEIPVATHNAIVQGAIDIFNSQEGLIVQPFAQLVGGLESWAMSRAQAILAKKGVTVK